MRQAFQRVCRDCGAGMGAAREVALRQSGRLRYRRREQAVCLPAAECSYMEGEMYHG